MIQVRMRQQQVVDICGLKSERLSVFLKDFTATLVQAAINQNLVAGTLNQVTGTGDIPIRTVE